MTVGTKSVIGGAHCFLVHPFFTLLGWARLFGFPWDPRIWFACFLHDIGYLGRPNMDGDAGEEHVILGALIMGALFGPVWADEYKLCGIRENFKSFLRQRGMGVRGKGAASPLAPLSKL
jgi:hypothetical protein